MEYLVYSFWLPVAAVYGNLTAKSYQQSFDLQFWEWCKEYLIYGVKQQLIYHIPNTVLFP
jgi:hypothetical protein